MSPAGVNPRRTRLVREGGSGEGPVLYWMHREHRARDNWPLLFAADLAARRGLPLVVAHCLDPAYPMATPGHFRFLLEGLKEVRRELESAGLVWRQLLGSPPLEVAALARALEARCLVTDFDPLRHKRTWLASLAKDLDLDLHEVDGRNVAPCFVTSDKAEYMARTIRPKLHALLPEFLEDYPALPEPQGGFRGGHDRSRAAPIAALPGPGEPGGHHEWPAVERALRLEGVPPPRFFAPGPAAAALALERFVLGGLHGYAENRNDPSRHGQSDLSPWLHFGMLSAQRAALAAAASRAPAQDKEAFLEELIVRRELSDNFCLHRQDYDQTSCYPDWARRTLARHAADQRPWLYGRAQLEEARTHDPAWNAAQTEMLLTGKMHGYMRMYWGKKLLEWTSCPEEAQEIAVALNDRHELDGRDPNGYAGIAWCLGGVHDRPWKERPVFGQIRYMNFQGLTRKFDIQAYLDKVARLKEEVLR